MENMNISLDQTGKDHFCLKLYKGKNETSILFKRIGETIFLWEICEFENPEPCVNNSEIQSLFKKLGE